MLKPFQLILVVRLKHGNHLQVKIEKYNETQTAVYGWPDVQLIENLGFSTNILDYRSKIQDFQLIIQDFQK